MSIKVHVAGHTGTGKTTIATLIQKYLQTAGFVGVTVELTDHEMPPCQSDLMKRTAALIDKGTKITVIESPTRGDANYKRGLPPNKPTRR